MINNYDVIVNKKRWLISHSESLPLREHTQRCVRADYALCAPAVVNIPHGEINRLFFSHYIIISFDKRGIPYAGKLVNAPAVTQLNE